MHITMVNIAVHQTPKRPTRPKEPNAMEVKFSWIVCAALMIKPHHARVKVVQMQVKYYKDKELE